MRFLSGSDACGSFPNSLRRDFAVVERILRRTYYLIVLMPLSRDYDGIVRFGISDCFKNRSASVGVYMNFFAVNHSRQNAINDFLGSFGSGIVAGYINDVG